jgi:hypothetical protein
MEGERGGGRGEGEGGGVEIGGGGGWGRGQEEENPLDPPPVERMAVAAGGRFRFLGGWALSCERGTPVQYRTCPPGVPGS